LPILIPFLFIIPFLETSSILSFFVWFIVE
jgi:hypothetical protein